MRLVTFRTVDGLRLGLEVEGGVLDLARAADALGEAVPADIHALIEGGDEAREAVARVASQIEGRSDLLVEPGSLQMAPCVPRPQKIIAVGLNYRRHAEEVNMAVPTTPVLFCKFANALSGHGNEIFAPQGSRHVDYEAELALVIGRRAQRVPRGEGLAHIFGYCAANDLSERELQFRTSQWLLGKTCDGFCPIGPALVTADEIGDPNRLTIRCYVNGEIRQDSNTADMIFSCNFLVHYISQFMTLEPGDVILTGTPWGVATGYPEAERSRYWLKDGDQVTVQIERIGDLTNRIRVQ